MTERNNNNSSDSNHDVDNHEEINEVILFSNKYTVLFKQFNKYDKITAIDNCNTGTLPHSLIITFSIYIRYQPYV